MVTLPVVLGLCFAAIVASVIAVATARRPKPAWASQIDHYGDSAKPEANSLIRSALGLSQRVMRQGSMEERSALDLARAGLSFRPHEWLLARGLITLASMVLLSLLTGPVAGVLLGGLLGWLGTRTFLRTRIARRVDAFADQLPDALQLVATSLRTGFSVPQALDQLSHQSNQPLGDEMARALAQTRLGLSVEDALDGVSERMHCRDLHWVVLAIRIQREVGGNLADVIDTTVETMRERARLRRHVRSLSAEGRLSAYVLIALPIVMSAVMFTLRRSYIQPLFTEPLGIVMITAGALFMAAGWFWLSRLIKMEA